MPEVLKISSNSRVFKKLKLDWHYPGMKEHRTEHESFRLWFLNTLEIFNFSKIAIIKIFALYLIFRYFFCRNREFDFRKHQLYSHNESQSVKISNFLEIMQLWRWPSKYSHFFSVGALFITKMISIFETFINFVKND